MSLMNDIAERLGVKMGEKFCIKHYRGHLLNDWQSEAILVFQFTEDRGLVCTSTEDSMYQTNNYLSDLILGRYKIVPYAPGCEIPSKDPELKKIFEYWDDIHDELHGYINTEWLENKKPFFFKDEKKKDDYVQLCAALKNTDKQLEHILELPIFKEVRDERNK